MAETIIKKVRGDDLEPKECAFCGSKDNLKFFGTNVDKRYDGMVMRHFGVCDEHLAKINAILSGEFDIDRIDLERFRKVHIGKGLRLRLR
ncbi:unnamed protein product [marine sediment metagenome]|uniref:Uncharacterized protein n=1 Tax=marine sediment metagenome TaxID=412755 RepID=X0V3S8_9ZZZZ